MSGAVMRRMGRLLQRVVARDASTLHVPRRQHAHEQARRGAGVAAIDGRVGLRWARRRPSRSRVPARLPSACVLAGDLGAQSARTARDGGAHVLGVQHARTAREVPSAMAENSTARCEMDLSPGTRDDAAQAGRRAAR